VPIAEWNIAIGTRWAVSPMSYTIQSSSAPVGVPVNVTPPYLVNPMAYTIQFAFLTTDPPEPQPTSGQWVSGVWAPNQFNPPPYQAYCLVGTGGAAVLTAGTYWIWVKINATGSSESPVFQAGPLFVQ